MNTFSADAVTDCGTAILTEHRVPGADARTVAASLVTADLWGHPSHGMLRLPWYVARLQSGAMNPVSAAEIADTPGLAGLKAVREGRVHLVDEAVTSRPTPRLVEGMRAVAAICYPERFGTGGAR